VTVTGRGRLLLFRLLDHQRLGGEQHAGDRRGVCTAERVTFTGSMYALRDEVAVLACGAL